MGKAKTGGVKQKVMMRAVNNADDATAALLNTAEWLMKAGRKQQASDYLTVAEVVVALRRGLPGGRAA